MSELEKYYNLIISNHFLKSASLVLLSIVFAKLVDVVFTIIFKKMVDKTSTKLDDKILHLLHKPIFYSILFICFFSFFKRLFSLSECLGFFITLESLNDFPLYLFDITK